MWQGGDGWLPWYNVGPCKISHNTRALFPGTIKNIVTFLAFYRSPWSSAVVCETETFSSVKVWFKKLEHTGKQFSRLPKKWPSGKELVMQCVGSFLLGFFCLKIIWCLTAAAPSAFHVLRMQRGILHHSRRYIQYDLIRFILLLNNNVIHFIVL